MASLCFLPLPEQHIDLDEIISIIFCNHFYALMERICKYPLKIFLLGFNYSAHFSILTDQILLIFLHYSESLREFYCFNEVLDASKIIRFK